MKQVIIAGSGIKDVSHLTKEVEGHIRNADLVILSVNNPIMDYYIRKNAKQVYSLDYLYAINKEMPSIYQQMSDVVIDKTNEFDYVLCLFYGHPNIFVEPSKLIYEKCNKLNLPISILPGISSIDCLFTDFRLDPLKKGCSIFDATYFLNKDVTIDKKTPLILMQIGFINCVKHKEMDNISLALTKLELKLLKYFNKETKVFIYESSQTSINECYKLSITINDIKTLSEKLNKRSTLLINP